MVGWLPYPMGVPWGPGHAQGQRPCLRQRKGGGEGIRAWACGQRQGQAPGSPLLLPRDKAPWCWAPPPPQALLTAAVLPHEWGLSSTAPLAWPRQVEPQDSGSQKRSWGGSPRVASGKGLQQVGQIRSVPRQAPLAAMRGQLCWWGSLSLAGSDPRAQPPGLAGLPPESGSGTGAPSFPPAKGGACKKGEATKARASSFPL